MTTPAALTPGFRRLGDHVIERRSRDLRNRDYVVEERDQSDAHLSLLALRCPASRSLFSFIRKVEERSAGFAVHGIGFVSAQPTSRALEANFLRSEEGLSQAQRRSTRCCSGSERQQIPSRSGRCPGSLRCCRRS